MDLIWSVGDFVAMLGPVYLLQDSHTCGKHRAQVKEERSEMWEAFVPLFVVTPWASDCDVELSDLCRCVLGVCFSSWGTQELLSVIQLQWGRGGSVDLKSVLHCLFYDSAPSLLFCSWLHVTPPSPLFLLSAVAKRLSVCVLYFWH